MNMITTTVGHPSTVVGRILANLRRRRRASYLRMRLHNVEADIAAAKASVNLWESVAGDIRAELALLGELRA
jgi:hypothetical protein